MKKRILAILLTASLLVGVMTASAFAAITFDSSSKVKATGDDNDIGLLIQAKKEDGLFTGQEITTADANLAEAVFTGTSSGGDLEVSVTISPGTSGLTGNYTPTSGSTYKGSVKFSGTVSTTIKSKQEYTVTFNAKQGTDTETFTAKFTVIPKPVINTATKPGDVVWGEEFSFTPKLSSGAVKDTAGWTLLNALPSGTTDANFLKLDDFKKTGLKIDADTGAITGKWDPDSEKKSTGMSDASPVEPSTDGTDVTKNIYLQATVSKQDTAAAPATSVAVFTLKFKPVVPTIQASASDVTSKFETAAFKYDTAVAEGDGVTILATTPTPADASWDVKPATGTLADYGLEIKAAADTTDKRASKLTIYSSVKPKTTVKNLKLTITAKNGKGKSTPIEPVITIGTDKFGIFTDTGGSTAATDATILKDSGNGVVGKTYAEQILYAYPGPIKWTATNLPEGVELKVDPKDSTKATISGTYKAARKDKKDATKHFSIKAVNENFTTNEKTLSNDLMVWDKPEITAATLFKKNVIDTGTKLNFEVTAKNMPVSRDWVVKIGTTTLKAKGSAPTGNGYNVTLTSPAFTGKSFVSIDCKELIENEKLVFVGSLDCVPKNGQAIKISITAENPAGSVTKDYEVTVKGKAPALKKEDITLTGTTPKYIKVTAGDGPITMKAYIDKKNAEKFFGKTDEIDITKANDTGLRFTDDTTNKLGSGDIKFEGANGTASNLMAYKKLPVTIEASNSDISDKAASAVYTVSIAATNKPTLQVNTAVPDYKLAENAELKEKEELTVEANKALTNIGLKATGDGPLTVTVKPLEKNGLIATVNETASPKTITISGTPSATKKDVVTKFSIEVKNPSTGDSKKTEFTITAKPTPVSENDMETTAIVGKKIKLTPKASVAPAGMKWQIATNGISGGSTTGAGAVTTEDTLKDLYGLEFDEEKGTISGVAKAATGKDTPIKINYYASSDLAVSATHTATITILGAKPKLTVKKLTLTTGETPTTTIDTNLKGKEKTEADVQFNGTFDDALSGLAINTTTTPNVGTLTGAASKAIKKQVVEFTLNNYGTEAKGKVTFMVIDPDPTITSTNSSATVNAGESDTVEVEVNGATNTDLKYKWKISKKPVGVNAKIKGNGSKATITIKANKKAQDATTDLEVTVTDPLSKKTSPAFPVTITVVGAEEKSATPLETKDAAPEAEAEDEVALGEGEVTFGAERTAGSLTAAQRRVIAEQGYVIAAVLPEIEVTADGQYDFEVDLDEEVAAGAELVWFAFSSKPTTDDEIVDFADENNEETKVVPESHVVIVTPWLNAGAKYAPVIAVKADASEADATTAEGVKEAAEEKAE